MYFTIAAYRSLRRNMGVKDEKETDREFLIKNVLSKKLLVISFEFEWKNFSSMATFATASSLPT